MTMTHEDKARMEKAAKIATCLRGHGISSEAAARMTQEEWCRVAACAKAKPPSETTREMVVHFLRIAETPVAMSGADLFAGFAGPEL